MSKRILVKEAGFIDFIKSFFNAKSQGKENKYIQTIRNYDPDLADAWARWDRDADNALLTVKQYYLKQGNPEKAKEIDDLIAKYK